MSALKLSAFLIITLFFSGCAEIFGTQKPTPPKTVVKQPQIPAKNGIIKGVITDLTYSDNGWCYDISSVDTTNSKLNSGKFCSDKHYFSTNDLIYATIVNNRIKSMDLIRSNNTKSQKTYRNLDSAKIQKSPANRISGKKNIVEVPKTEKISFD